VGAERLTGCPVEKLVVVIAFVVKKEASYLL
jgi:hypothetical protein